MSGALTAATVIAGISAATTVGSTIYSAVSASGGSKEAQAPTVDTTTATNEVNQDATSAAAARTQLLETAGGSAGQTLSPGQVSNNKNSIFGN